MLATSQNLTQLDGILDHHLMQLLKQSLYLLERESRQITVSLIVDYGFVVFTGAIVYEGFLKRFLYTLGLISPSQLKSDSFRIGKALNPDLPQRYRDQSYAFDHIAELCSREVALFLWEAWKEGRNQVFHYDFLDKKNITLSEAEERINLFVRAMLLAMECEKTVKRELD
jgi:hypothetical protein